MTVKLLRNGQPRRQIWVGNFFEPFYSDRAAMSASLEHVKELGFNVVNLDSKSSEDFFDRYQGGGASDYVRMQEFMMSWCREHGLQYTFLALYLNGDNLFAMGIRDAPPARGEEALRVDGTSADTWKYWSSSAQRVMLQHVKGLTSLYREGMASFEGEGAIYPLQTMFDPCISPSFDPEGRARYLTWLEDRYGGDLAMVNGRYGTEATTFDDLAPEDYWYQPDVIHLTWAPNPPDDDYAKETPDFYRYLDNQRWRRDELVQYFATMEQQFRAADPSLYLEPVLQQWGGLFNPPHIPGWDTTRRALDPYEVAPYVDAVQYIAAPLSPEGMPDAHVLSAEYAVHRSANNGRPFAVGLYLGRHVEGDIYATVSPAEAIATAVASGASGYHVYGYSGLDDGGVLAKMDEEFLQSVRVGNTWAAQVIPRLSGERAREVALLYPSALYMFEPLTTKRGTASRVDLLGWYKECVNLGYHVDVLHPLQVKEGLLHRYPVLIVPDNRAYSWEADPALEAALRSWVDDGGCLVHGPRQALVTNTFGLCEEPVELDYVQWPEPIIPYGAYGATSSPSDDLVAYPEAEVYARYSRQRTTAIGRSPVGRGVVWSFGFCYGYAYASRGVPTALHSREEAVALPLVRRTPLAAILKSTLTLKVPGQVPGRPGVEVSRFGSERVVVNHRNLPVRVDTANTRHTLWQYPVDESLLLPHSAVLLEE